MTTTLRLPGRIERLPQLRRIARGGLAARGSIGVGLAAKAGGAASWWLAGGAPVPIAAYQPKGAANLAASYINLVNPGTYNAAPGVAPTLGVNGWTFVKAAGQYLLTGIVQTSTAWSALMRYSGWNVVGTEYLFGALSLAAYSIGIDKEPSMYFLNGGFTSGMAVLSEGVSGIAGLRAYKNGVDVGGISLGAVPNVPIALGGVNNNGTLFHFANVTVQAFVIWNTILIAPMVAAISAAMAAL